MKQIITTGIVLARTNFQEADRILTLLTPDQGKVRVIARGVRKERSKLAGGVELFSISEIGFMPGRGDLATLTTSRLKTHFGTIVRDLARTSAGFEFLKLLQKVTEDNAEQEYFDLLAHTLEALDNPVINLELLQLWFDVSLLTITGHGLNLRSDTNGEALRADGLYHFDIDNMAFQAHPAGVYNANHLKLLRLVTTQELAKLVQLKEVDGYVLGLSQLARSTRRHILHV